jgi:hypothetical protein
MPTDRKISRRTWLGRLAGITAAVGMPSILAFANPTDVKASKPTVHYRDTPKGMQMCGMCKFYERGEMTGGGMMCGGMSGEPDGEVIEVGMMRSGMMTGECQVVEVESVQWDGATFTRQGEG